MVAVYETKVFGLTDRLGDMPSTDPELLELALRSFEPPVSLAGMLHVLKQQEVDNAARVVLNRLHRVQEIHETLVGKVVRGELLVDAAGQEPEVRRDP